MSQAINSKRPGYIQEFEGLRGLMALWVFLGHICNRFGIFYSSDIEAGYRLATLTSIPVYIFICLSGFAIFTLLGNKWGGYNAYLLGRFFRIFPIYLIVLFLALFLWQWRFDLGGLIPPDSISTDKRLVYQSTHSHYAQHLLAHLVLLQGLVPNEFLYGSSESFLAPAWSLSLEWQFYLVAPFIFLLMSRSFLIGSLLVVVLIAADVAIKKMGYTFTFGAMLTNNIGFFVAGFGAYFITKKNYLAFATCLFIALLQCVFRYDTQTAVLATCLWLGAIAVFATEMRFLQPIRVCGQWFMLSRPIVLMGKLSFSVYLLHVLVIDICYYVGLKNQLFLDNKLVNMLILGLFALVITYAICYLLHKYIELKFMDVGRRLQISLGSRNG